MKIFQTTSWADLARHIAFLFIVGIVLILLFFFVYLPVSTNHGETLTVPDVIGVNIEDLDEFLNERNLRYEVTADSGFSAEVPPLSVLKQVPLPNSKVKENRKIYVTLNAEHAPLVRMPKLIDGSVKNAQLVLKTYDLKLGNIIYRPNLALNYVLDQRLDGRSVLEGEKIPKGSAIDLVAGDGFGQVNLESPNLIDLDLESAQFAIVGSGLKIGDVTHEKTGIAVIESKDDQGNILEERKQVAPGAVFNQRPKPGTNMRIMQKVDIWIYSPDSLNVNPTLLDQ